MDVERTFLMDGLREAIGHLPDYKIRFAAAGWRDKGVLLKEDIEELKGLLDTKNSVQNKITDEAGEIL